MTQIVMFRRTGLRDCITIEDRPQLVDCHHDQESGTVAASVLWAVPMLAIAT
jgi:hypothetical protein